jgi:hypothetical protein
VKNIINIPRSWHNYHTAVYQVPWLLFGPYSLQEESEENTSSSEDASGLDHAGATSGWNLKQKVSTSVYSES